MMDRLTPRASIEQSSLWNPKDGHGQITSPSLDSVVASTLRLVLWWQESWVDPCFAQLEWSLLLRIFGRHSSMTPCSRLQSKIDRLDGRGFCQAMKLVSFWWIYERWNKSVLLTRWALSWALFKSTQISDGSFNGGVRPINETAPSHVASMNGQIKKQ